MTARQHVEAVFELMKRYQLYAKISKCAFELRGFLGLDGYYMRFIKGFGSICKPLHELMKKDGFLWTKEFIAAFDRLKQALVFAPLLAMPDYSKSFTVETDASGKGIGAVLMQQGHPIAYISGSLAP
uniref:Uncharacterized mitochondrial protein AtMg00860-like n=1 Tax=Nicotiana tabacum TaxID=4097 RepID=A0A1S4BBD4_TOBAC|nr:PREDICTED: uncharacterized mitochondrial protein AtMg00860-like [Nicotiana tabacum]